MNEGEPSSTNCDLKTSKCGANRTHVVPRHEVKDELESCKKIVAAEGGNQPAAEQPVVQVTGKLGWHAKLVQAGLMESAGQGNWLARGLNPVEADSQGNGVVLSRISPAQHPFADQ